MYRGAALRACNNRKARLLPRVARIAQVLVAIAFLIEIETIVIKGSSIYMRKGGCALVGDEFDHCSNRLLSENGTIAKTHISYIYTW